MVKARCFALENETKMIRFLQTPGPLKKYLLGGILILICASMVWYLVPGGIGFTFGGPPAGVVAQVGAKNITSEEVRQAAQMMLQQEMPQGGANMERLLPLFAQRAAEQLITRQALVVEAKHMGLRATPAAVRDELQHGRYATTFFPGGKFIGQQEYEDFLLRNNLIPAQFEADVGTDILIRELQAIIAGSVSVSSAAVHQQFIRQNSKVQFDYAVLTQDEIKRELHPTKQELEAFYESHKNTYVNSIPEKRKVLYALIDAGKAEVSVRLTPNDLQAYYNQHRDEYHVPEQLKVSHIWIKMPLPGPSGAIDQKKVADARQRADDLLKQLKHGASFDALARKYSEDPGSAKEGGSLGWIGREQMTPEFAKAAFSLGKGQISGVVESADGFHIIRLDDKQEAHIKTLAEVKDQIGPILKREKGLQVMQRKADELVQNARAQGLKTAAAAQGLPLIATDFFPRSDSLPGLGSATQFMNAVFAAGENSPPEESPVANGMVVFQLLAVRPPTTPTFEEIRSRVEEDFKNERSSLLLAQKTRELSERAKAEHDLKRAARELDATIKTSGWVLPDGQVPDIGSMTGPASVAFNMKPDEISSPIISGENGIVLDVVAKQLPSDADFVAQRDQIRNSLVQAKQQELLGVFVTSLQEGMEKSGKIKINQIAMNALTRTEGEEM